MVSYAAAMDEFDRDARPRSPSPRQVARLLLPAFAASALVVVVGVVLVLVHHRTIGVILVVIGAVGGFFLRAALMLRSQRP